MDLDRTWTWSKSRSGPIPTQPKNFFGPDLDWTGPGPNRVQWTRLEDSWILLKFAVWARWHASIFARWHPCKTGGNRRNNALQEGSRLRAPMAVGA